MLTLRDEDGRDVAVSVSSFDRESKVLLLVYLAVRPGIRGGGLGGALLRASQARWAEDFAPDFVVGEVERPGDRTTADEAHGDPEARLRFYRRFGALRVEAPFFQPGMHGPADRVPMYLMLLHVADGARLAEPAPGQVLVAAKPLHDFLVRYITDTEGEPPRDAMARALLEPLEGESVLAVLL